MLEGKDPAIKLFGKTIQLPDGASFSQDALSGDGGGSGDAACVKSEDRSSSSTSSSDVGEERESDDNNKDLSNEKSTDKDESKSTEDTTDPNNPTSILTDTTKTSESESLTPKTSSKSEEEQTDTSNNERKTLKKPDKILPCPRCNSMDTKFCYYNNYNVNQPRHFCKNCQRYWTAGGTMRNVPVGAGRRKNKTSASQYRQITVSDSSLPMDLTHTVLNPNGTVLTFGSVTDNTPLHESMASVLKIADKTTFNKPEELIIPINKDDVINRPLVNESQTLHGFSPQVPCFPMYPWTPQMGPAFCPPGFPMPFYPPAPYWGCPVPVPVPGPYWVPTNYHSTPPNGPISPTLGKHSRDENVKCGESETIKENETEEKSLWVPKTLRIDDPDEAAKSSIWATLGIKKDGSAPVNRGGIFKAFESKKEEKKNVMQETSPALQANPAALSRSLNFQESS